MDKKIRLKREKRLNGLRKSDDNIGGIVTDHWNIIEVIEFISVSNDQSLPIKNDSSETHVLKTRDLYECH